MGVLAELLVNGAPYFTDIFQNKVSDNCACGLAVLYGHFSVLYGHISVLYGHFSVLYGHRKLRIGALALALRGVKTA